jgi:uncharacterized protein with HEPN domain
LIPAYFGIDWGIVWHAASSQVPELRLQVEVLLRDQFGLDT